MQSIDAGLPSPQGAFLQADGSTLWQIWAPKHSSVGLVVWQDDQRREYTMQAEECGHFVFRLPHAPHGTRYAYRLPGHDRDFPDPVSRWQPDGVHAPSAVFDPHLHPWTVLDWHAPRLPEFVIYELHVGTFTPEGTFAAIIPRLPALAELGITAIELMPVAQFAGARNWGYDGVHPFAVQNSYGGPLELQRLVNAAHEAGLAVILDVVFNHLGPEGNYFGLFGNYFTNHYHTPWGDAINYDGPDCEPVRRLVLDCAAQWIRDFQIDGLRLDAVQMIYDFGPVHILADLQHHVQAVAAQCGRSATVIAETDQNDPKLLTPPSVGGYGLDGIWSDDFHHALHSVLTGEHDGYYEDFGSPQKLAKAFEKVFVNDGCYSAHRRRRHGRPAGELARERFVFCIQNHDQVGNRALGERLTQLVPAAAARLAAGLLLISPGTPLLFMGEEYGETHPFPFFCSFGDEELNEAVRRGRCAEFESLNFQWRNEIPDPTAESTFQSGKLGWSWPAGSPSAERRRLYRDLLKLRRTRDGLRDRTSTAASLINDLGPPDNHSRCLLVKRGKSQPIIVIANLSSSTYPRPQLELSGYECLLTTEAAQYGGARSDSTSVDLLPFELQLFARPE